MEIGRKKIGSNFQPKKLYFPLWGQTAMLLEKSELYGSLQNV